jgi:hypothetical protein
MKMAILGKIDDGDVPIRGFVSEVQQVEGGFLAKSRLFGDCQHVLVELVPCLVPSLFSDEELEVRMGDKGAATHAEKFAYKDVGINDQPHVSLGAR